jgi:SAM-dependent methyltransferase
MEDLQDFLSRFRHPRVIDEIAKRSHITSEEARGRLEIYLNEVPVGLDLIRSELRPGDRVLEVGAGLCMLSLYLRWKGYDVVAVEPTIVGYDFFEQSLPIILSAIPEVSLPLFRCGAEELRPDQCGLFDLIFSIHVLEHVADLAGAFRAMSDVLAPGGRMLHLCPNYAVPYEPHFGRPLLPILPRMSRPWMGPLNRRPGIWESLNFISCMRVKRLASENGMDVRFDRGLLAEALERLGRDTEFARRHTSALIRGAARLARYRLFISLVRQLPAGWATPMRFKVSRRVTAHQQ